MRSAYTDDFIVGKIEQFRAEAFICRERATRLKKCEMREDAEEFDSAATKLFALANLLRSTLLRRTTRKKKKRKIRVKLRSGK